MSLPRRDVDPQVVARRRADLGSMLDEIKSTNDPSRLLAATISVNNMLRLVNPPLNEVVQSGLLPRFVEMSSSDDHLHLKFEAAWVLSKISKNNATNNDHIEAIINCGAVPVFIRFFRSNRDREFHLGVSTLGVLSRYWPNAFAGHEEGVCETLSVMTDSTETHSKLLESGITMLLIRMLKHGALQTQIYATLAIFNITFEDNAEHIMTLVNQGCIKRLVGVLQCSHAQTVLRAIWALDHILKSYRYDEGFYLGYPYKQKLIMAGGYDVLVKVWETHEVAEVRDHTWDFIERHLQEGG